MSAPTIPKCPEIRFPDSNGGGWNPRLLGSGVAALAVRRTPPLPEDVEFAEPDLDGAGEGFR